MSNMLYVVARRKHVWSYRFRLQSVGAGVEVTSAFLWLHKNRDVDSSGSRLTLNVSSVCDDKNGDRDSLRPRSRRYQLAWTSGWVQLDITDILQCRTSKLTVRCVGSSSTRCRRVMGASSARRRPLIVVGTTTVRQFGRRSRRHLRRCVDNDCCARYEYYVSFAQLGWDFIIQPRGFSVNYCYGSCTS